MLVTVGGPIDRPRAQAFAAVAEADDEPSRNTRVFGERASHRRADRQARTLRRVDRGPACIVPPGSLEAP